MTAGKPRLPRGKRAAVVVIAVVALAVLGQASVAALHEPPWLGLRTVRRNGHLVISWVQPAGLAWDDGIRPGAIVIAVSNQPEGTLVRPGAVANASSVQVRDPTGALLTVVAVASPTLGTPEERFGFLAIAACFVVIGGAIFVLAADVLDASMMLSLTVTAAAMLEAAMATRVGASWALALEFVTLACFGASAVLLFLNFPVPRLHTRSGRSIAAVCLAATAALVIAYGWTVLVDTSAYVLLRPALYVVLTAELLAAGLLVALSCAQTSPGQAEARRMAALMAVGTAAGLAPFCLLALVPYLLGFGFLLAPDVAILSLGLLPVSLGGAILSRQFLGIDRFIRRNLVAAVVWTALLAIYSLGIDGLLQTPALHNRVLTSPFGDTLLGVTLVAGTFPFAQARLRRLLERTFFHDVYHYSETLQDLSAAIGSLAGVADIATFVLERVGHTLDLTWAALVVVAAPEGLVRRWGRAPDEQELRNLLAGGAAGPRQETVDGRPRPCQCIPLVAQGAMVGLLAAGPKRHDVDLTPEDEALLATLAPLAATAIQNARLLQRLEQQMATLDERQRALTALSRQLSRAQEEERRRIALDVHDDPLARLTLLVRELAALPGQARSRRCQQAAQDASDALRAICQDLHPSVLTDLGLGAGLESLVNEVRVRSDLTASVAVGAADGACFGRLDGELELALYRVAQEALNNCVKHAEANAVTVWLWTDRRRVRLNVADDGIGYEWPPACPDRLTSIGLFGMRERLRPWGGVVGVGRGTPGGTVVSAEVVLGGDDARTPIE